jgi:hypothetical protein
MELEIVALGNPYAGSGLQDLPVQLFYQGKTHADAQIEVFERAPDGAVIVSRLRSDAEGTALVPLKPGHSYLLDTVGLRPVPPGKDAVWRSLWASLTFAAP